VVAVGAGNAIALSHNGGTNWSYTGTSASWRSVASSSDGDRIIAVADSGEILVSGDAGSTWTPRTNNQQWQSVASSVDGRLIAASTTGGLFTSSDFGATWAQHEANDPWISVASSADGSLLAAVKSSFSTAYLYTSVMTTTPGTGGGLSGGSGTAIELQYIGNGVFMPLSYIGKLTAW